MKSKFLTAGLIAAMMVPAMAQAQTREIRNDRKELREEQRDLRDAQRRGDRSDIRDGHAMSATRVRICAKASATGARIAAIRTIAPRSNISSSASARRCARTTTPRLTALHGTAAGACRAQVAT